LMGKELPSLKIGDLEAKVPIIQGGMGVGISMSGLASAVANEGGIGVIASAGVAMHEPDYEKNVRAANKRALEKEIKKAKSQTKGPIGVNILVALSDYDALSVVCMEAGADLLFLGAGLPLKVFGDLPKSQVKDVKIKIVPIISSARALNVIFQSWLKNYDRVPDAVVVEGPLAGGHLGFKREQIDDPAFELEKLVPEVVSAVESFEQRLGVSIPVIAAGGIYTGGDILKFLNLGAKGVQMATRFIATYECDAYPEFKEAVLKCKKEDIIIIDSPVGLPGRAIRNEFLNEVSNGKKMPFKCPWKCLRTCDYTIVPYCIALALINAKKGLFEEGFAFTGANGYRVDKIVSVKELIQDLVAEYNIAASAAL
jgi:nitronate monooxygenase